MPYPGRDALSAEEGMVQFTFRSYPVELIQFLWKRAEPGVDLQTYVDEFGQMAAQQEGVEITAAAPRSGTKDGHSAIYQAYSLVDQEFQLRGMIGTWLCAESERVYVASYATDPQVSDQDLDARFQEHLDAFACHAGSR
jgi:hypothetical protein